MNEKSEDTVRSWPALDIRPVSELLQAALVDYDATAVDERAVDDWRVFFTSAGERDRALAALRAAFPEVTIEPIDVPDENWAARSQASLRAVRVGRIVVAPPWDRPADGDLVIVIGIRDWTSRDDPLVPRRAATPRPEGALGPRRGHGIWSPRDRGQPARLDRGHRYR